MHNFFLYTVETGNRVEMYPGYKNIPVIITFSLETFLYILILILPFIRTCRLEEHFFPLPLFLYYNLSDFRLSAIYLIFNKMYLMFEIIN